jgi:hypothetical protein
MNIDVANKWLSAGASVAVIVGVVIAVIGATVAIRTLRQSQQVESAELTLKIDAMLEDHRYDRITFDIQNHGSNYHLPKYKSRSDADVEEYMGVFEDLGSFIDDNMVNPKMAYDHFSYDIEKAWCNIDVQDTIRKARATDKSKTAPTNPMFGSFEKLAKEYLAPAKGNRAATWINNRRSEFPESPLCGKIFGLPSPRA